MQRNLILIKLNQVVCEYFLPSVFAKINELNAHYKRLGMTQDEQRQATSDKQELQNQIAEENQFVLMCRDYVDLIRVFVNFNNQQLGASSATTTAVKDEDDIEDENEVQTEILDYLIFNLFKTLL